MKVLTLIVPLVLAGCVTMQPHEMARHSNYDVCRLSMGGPHSRVADAEARNRGLDCTPMYGAIAAQERARNEATDNFVRTLKGPPPPRQTNCTSYRVGNQVETTCR